MADTTNGTWHVFCEDQVVMGAHIDGRVFTRRMWGRHFDLGNTENGCMDVLERGRCDIGAVVYFFDVDIFGNPPMDLRRFLPFPAFSYLLSCHIHLIDSCFRLEDFAPLPFSICGVLFAVFLWCVLI